MPALARSLADVLARLHARIPLGMRLGLEPMRAACERVGHPERAFEAVHVAGTNGKGSVCAMTASMARVSGVRTGLYTSPHLCRFAERIVIDGEPLDDDALTATLAQALDAGPDLSFFETATLAAFLAFRAARVDLAVLEVGLGGRLDATSVIPTPRAAAITRIALDHTDRLGATLVAIAREKAGIAKPGLDIALGPMQRDVREAIDEIARAAGATTSSVAALPAGMLVGLAGEHQRDNAAIAAALGARIGASPGAIASGIASPRWPGRLERIEGFLLDAAHNPDGAQALARYLASPTYEGLDPRRTVLVFGALAGKDWPAMLDALAPLATERVYVAPSVAGATAPGGRGGVDPSEMTVRHAGRVAATVDDALAAARRLAPALVVVAGSIFLVGQARALLLGLPVDPAVPL